MTRTWISLARTASALALAGALAACANSGAASPPAATAAASASPPLVATAPASAGAASPAPSSAGAVTPSPAASLPTAPPSATLAGLHGATTAAGSIGTYTWNGGGSDAPWVVGKRVGTATAGASLTAAFGDLVPKHWTAAWAKVRNGSAGSPVGASSGGGEPALTAPAAGGDWSLRVTAEFAPGASATYYWRLTVAP